MADETADIRGFVKSIVPTYSFEPDAALSGVSDGESAYAAQKACSVNV